jgi:cytochrome b561
MVNPSPPAYTPVARVLHWLTAALVLTAIAAGITMKNFLGEGPAQNFLYNLHWSIGATLIPILLVRLIYRLTHWPLPLPDDIPPFQRITAAAVHWLLYVLLVVQPIVGWIAKSAYGGPITVFWAINLPPIWEQDEDFSEDVLFVHDVIGFALAGLLCLHIGAALFHHFVRRDRVLLRMVTGAP